MDAFESLHRRVRTDPDAAWPRVLAFIGANRDTAEAQDLIEDYVYEHDDRFIDHIEAAALADSTVRGVVLQAYVGGFAPPERSRSITCKPGSGSLTSGPAPLIHGRVSVMRHELPRNPGTWIWALAI